MLTTPASYSIESQVMYILIAFALICFITVITFKSRETVFIQWLISQVPAVAEAGQEGIHEPGTQCYLPMGGRDLST